MPKFHLDAHDGRRVELDPIGIDLRGAEDAFEVAVETAKRLLSNGRRKGEDRSRWALHVRREDGSPAFILRFELAAPEPHYNRPYRKGRPQAAP
jgi:hypothetical protein